MTEVEQDSERIEVSVPTMRPGWRARRYGKHRSRDQNFRAWFFADRTGRKILRELRQIKRRIERDRLS